MPTSSENAARARRLPGASEPPVFHRALRRFLVLMALVLLAVEAAMALIAARALEADLLPQLHRRTELIGDTVADRLSEALSLGIPLPDLVGMDRYLTGVLTTYPDLTYVAVTDLAGAVLFRAGPAPATLAAFGPDTDTGTAAETGAAAEVGTATETGAATRTIGAFFDTRVLLTEDGAAAGYLHIGRPLGARAEISLLWVPSLPVLFVVVFLLTAELLTMAFAGSYAVAWSWLRSVMRRIAAGDFSHRPILPQRTLLGRIATGTGAIVSDLNDRYQQLADEAEEVKADQLDRSITTRIDATVGALRDIYHFAPPGEETPVHPVGATRLRLPLLFLFSGIFLPIPYLIDAAYRLEPWMGWLDPAFLVAQFLTLLFGVATVLVMLMRATGFLGFLWDDPRGTLVLAGLSLAVAPVLGWLSGFTLRLIVWGSLTGLCLGFCIQAADRYAALANGGRPSSNGPGTVLSAAAVALAVTMPLGGLAVAIDRAPLLWLVAAMCALIGVFLALRLVLRVGVLRRLGTAEAAATAPAPGAAGTGRTLLIAVLCLYPLGGLVGGYVFYLLPLQLDALGLPVQVGGRAGMALGLVGVLAAPLVARLRPSRRLALLLLGLAGAAAGALVMLTSVLPDAGPSLITGAPWLGAAMAWQLTALLAGLALCLALAARMVLVVLAAQVERAGATSLPSASAAILAPAVLLGLTGGTVCMTVGLGLWGLSTALLACGGFVLATSVLLILVGLPGLPAASVAAPASGGR